MSTSTRARFRNWSRAVFTGVACLFALAAMSAANGANVTRLYDFEEGTAGNTTTSLADKVDQLTFVGSGGAAGLLWLEVPGPSPRPLQAGGVMDAVNAQGLTAPALESFQGSITYVASDSPQAGSTIAGRFDGGTVLDDFNTAPGSRGVYVDEIAFNNNDPVANGDNTFESFNTITQAWVKPDSSARGTAQTVWRTGSEQGSVRISGGSDPVWEFRDFGAFPDGGLFPMLPVAFDEWTNIMLYRAGNGAEVWINGELVIGDRSPDNPVFFNTFAPLISLGATDLAEEPFTGEVDHFQVLGTADVSLGNQDTLYCQTFPGEPQCIDPPDYFACDFNGDDACTIADLDLLVAEIVAGTNNTDFDLNGDGVVDLKDITDPDQSGPMRGWLALAGGAPENLAVTDGNPFLSGDADLNGVVDVSDFNVFNNNKFTTTGAWSTGDFNADGSTDVGDFNIFNNNKFTSSIPPGVVPEPTGLVCVLLAPVGFVAIRRR